MAEYIKNKRQPFNEGRNDEYVLRKLFQQQMVTELIIFIKVHLCDQGLHIFYSKSIYSPGSREEGN